MCVCVCVCVALCMCVCVCVCVCVVCIVTKRNIIVIMRNRSSLQTIGVQLAIHCIYRNVCLFVGSKYLT